MAEFDGPGRERLRRLAGDAPGAKTYEPGRTAAVAPAPAHAGGTVGKRTLAESWGAGTGAEPPQVNPAVCAASIDTARRHLATLTVAHASADQDAATATVHELRLALDRAHAAAGVDQRAAVDALAAEAAPLLVAVAPRRAAIDGTFYGEGRDLLAADVAAYRAARDQAPHAAELGMAAARRVADAAAAHGAREQRPAMDAHAAASTPSRAPIDGTFYGEGRDLWAGDVAADRAARDQAPNGAQLGEAAARRIVDAAAAHVARAQSASVDARAAASTPSRAPIDGTFYGQGRDLLAGDVAASRASREQAWTAAAAPIAAQLGVDAAIRVDDAAAAHGARGLAHAGVVHLAPTLAPEHADARHILAHELVHVAQSRLPVAGSLADAEHEADTLAAALVRGSLPHRPRIGIAAGVSAADTGAKGLEPAPADPDANAVPAGHGFVVDPQRLLLTATRSWLSEEEGFTATGRAPQKTLAMLEELQRQGGIAWATHEALVALSRSVATHTTGTVVRYLITGESYKIIGLPPNSAAMVAIAGDGLQVTFRVNGAPEGRGVRLLPEDIARLLTAIEIFTGLVIQPGMRAAARDFALDVDTGAGAAVMAVTADTMANLVGAADWKQWQTDHGHGHGEQPGAATPVSVSGELIESEQAHLVAWLAAHIPEGAGHAQLSRDLLQTVEAIEHEEHGLRDAILAVLARRGPEEAVDNATVKQAIETARYAFDRARLGLVRPLEMLDRQGTRAPLERQLPAHLTQHSDLVLDGDSVDFEVEIDWSALRFTASERAAFADRPWHADVEWVFERPDGALSRITQTTSATSGPITTSQKLSLFPFEVSAIWEAHAFVRSSHFEPTHVTTPVQVKTVTQRMTDLRSQALGDDQLASQLTPDADGHISGPGLFKTRTPAQRAAERKQQIDVYERAAQYLELSHSPLNDEAIIQLRAGNDERRKADEQIHADEAEGWTSFDVRATYLSKTDAAPSGALEIYGAVRFTQQNGADVVSVQLRDLSRRANQADLKFERIGPTFVLALESVVTALAKDYPRGRIAFFAEARDEHGEHPTGQTIGFERDTFSMWKGAKQYVFHPVYQAAVGLATALTMIFVPELAVPMLIVNVLNATVQSVDDLAERANNGTLKPLNVAMDMGQIALAVLPAASSARPIANSRMALFALEAVEMTGQVLLMGAQAKETLEALEAQDVAAIGQMYEELTTLEKSTHASDPRLPVLRAQIEERSAGVRDRTQQAFSIAFGQGVIFMMPGKVFEAIKVGQANAPHSNFEPEVLGGGQESPVGGAGPRPRTVVPHEPAPHEPAPHEPATHEPATHEPVAVVPAANEPGTRATTASDPDGATPEQRELLDANRRFAEPSARRPDGLQPRARLGEAATLSAEQHQLIARRVAASPGERLGETVDVSFQSDAQADIARWQTKALEDAASNPAPASAKERTESELAKQWLADPEFRHWYDVWMSMPDRVVVGADGRAKANVPHGAPAEMGERLTLLADKANVGLMTRALEISRRIEAELPGLDPDPSSAAWQQARPRLVEMLGEPQVKKYEMERMKGEADGDTHAMDERLRQLLKKGELARVQELIPGTQIYVTGSAAQAKEGAAIPDLDVIVVVPRGTPHRVQVEIEQQLASVKLARAGARGAWVPIDAKVMTEEQFLGLSMLDTPGRTPLVNYRIDEARPGAIPGTGRSGADLHNHVMGVSATQYFIDKVGGGSAATTLEHAVKDVEDPELWTDPSKPPVTPGVREQLRAGMADVYQAKAIGMAPEVIEARARRALDDVLTANPKTPFDATYDVRDLLVQKHIDPNGTFENYAHDVIADLHDQGVTYSEQSVSASKLDKRFTPEAMAAAHARARGEGKDSEMEFLVMVPTSKTLAAAPADAPRSGGAKTTADLALTKLLLRDDVKGMDIAGPEAASFTETGMEWFVERYRFLAEVAKQKGERLVLRPHVGEGYDPSGTGEHVAIARANLKMLVETLQGLGYDGSGDVIVRLGHATHAAPETLQAIAKLGVIIESNIGSNLATGSVLSADEHPLLANMYYGARTVLATDAQGVMSTTLPAEYQRAGYLIAKFRDGAPLQIGDETIHYGALTAEQKQRFSIEWLEQQVADYRAHAAESIHATPSPETP